MGGPTIHLLVVRMLIKKVNGDGLQVRKGSWTLKGLFFSTMGYQLGKKQHLG